MKPIDLNDIKEQYNNLIPNDFNNLQLESKTKVELEILGNKHILDSNKKSLVCLEECYALEVKWDNILRMQRKSSLDLSSYLYLITKQCLYYLPEHILNNLGSHMKIVVITKEGEIFKSYKSRYDSINIVIKGRFDKISSDGKLLCSYKKKSIFGDEELFISKESNYESGFISL